MSRRRRPRLDPLERAIHVRLGIGLGCILGALALCVVQPGQERVLHLRSEALTPAEAAEYFPGRTTGAVVSQMAEWPPAFTA